MVTCLSMEGEGCLCPLLVFSVAFEAKENSLPFATQRAATNVAEFGQRLRLRHLESLWLSVAIPRSPRQSQSLPRFRPCDAVGFVSRPRLCHVSPHRSRTHAQPFGNFSRRFSASCCINRAHFLPSLFQLSFCVFASLAVWKNHRQTFGPCNVSTSTWPPT